MLRCLSIPKSPKRIIYSIVLLIFLAIQFSPVTYAITDDQKRLLDAGIYYFDVEASDSCSDLPPGSSIPNTAAPSETQIQIAKIIMGVAKTNSIGQRGALIGLMAGLAESHLTIYANSNVPVSLSNPTKQAVGSDHDSVGVFQQRPSTSWSTYAPAGGTEAISNKRAVWQLMDPTYAAEAFFGSPPKIDAPAPLSKGLQNVSGWQSMNPWLAAQAVQHSAHSDGSNYQAQLSQARELINKYWESSPPVPLPVPLKSGSEVFSDVQIDSCNSASTPDGNCSVDSPVYGSQNGSGDEYNRAQLKMIFGDPGTATDHSAMESKMVSLNFLGHNVQVHPKAAGCLSSVAHDIKAANIKYKIREIGCYRFDSDNGSSNIGLSSYHTYGAACDINSDTNPFVGSGNAVTHDMPKEYVDIFHKHGFTWGGNWVSVKDYMHFEFNGIKP